jgi:PRTRC genetic system protein A
MIEPAAYIFNRDGAQPRTPPGKSFSYVVAGNGLFKHAESRFVEALIPLASARIAGLRPLEPAVRPRFMLPGAVLQMVLADARRQAWHKPVEAMYHVLVERDYRIRVLRPRQNGGEASLQYEIADERHIILDVHSHCEMGASFSPTDDHDEQGFCFYAVLGRIFSRPEIALRVGVYGDFWPLPASTLFLDAPIGDRDGYPETLQD